jgi:hypothetical protein
MAQHQHHRQAASAAVATAAAADDDDDECVVLPLAMGEAATVHQALVQHVDHLCRSTDLL